MLVLAQDLSVAIDGVTLDPLPAGLDELARAVVISLFTWRRARPGDVLPDGGGDRQGWWGDTFAPVEGDRIGSRLWLLARSALTQETLNRARDYAAEALAWLIEDGVAARVEVTAERMGLSGLALTCRIWRDDGKEITLRFANAWSALNG